MRLRMDPEQLAGMGIDEEIGIDLPEGFNGHTPAERRAWVQGQIEAIAAEMLADLGRTRGAVPTTGQTTAFLRSIGSCVDGVRSDG